MQKLLLSATLTLNPEMLEQIKLFQPRFFNISNSTSEIKVPKVDTDPLAVPKVTEKKKKEEKTVKTKRKRSNTIANNKRSKCTKRAITIIHRMFIV